MNDIEQLIEKYLDGDTTHAEEQQLQAYFASHTDIPADWQPYRALFAYVGEEQAKGKTVNLPHHRLRWAAAAACVATLASLAIAWPQDADSYAVIDGQRTTDSYVVMQEAELALQMVAASDDDTFDALNTLNLTNDTK